MVFQLSPYPLLKPGKEANLHHVLAPFLIWSFGSLMLVLILDACYAGLFAQCLLFPTTSAKAWHKSYSPS